MTEGDQGSDDTAAGGEATNENPKIIDFEEWKRMRMARRLLQQMTDFELLDTHDESLEQDDSAEHSL